MCAAFIAWAIAKISSNMYGVSTIASKADSASGASLMLLYACRSFSTWG
jgi:hypothetical protein